MYLPTGARGAGSGAHAFKPKRYAIRYNPPTVILEYGDESLGLLRTRKVSTRLSASAPRARPHHDSPSRRTHADFLPFSPPCGWVGFGHSSA